jgi:hypothetical protein
MWYGCETDPTPVAVGALRVHARPRAKSVRQPSQIPGAQNAVGARWREWKRSGHCQAFPETPPTCDNLVWMSRACRLHCALVCFQLLPPPARVVSSLGSSKGVTRGKKRTYIFRICWNLLRSGILFVLVFVLCCEVMLTFSTSFAKNISRKALISLNHFPKPLICGISGV